MSTIGVHQREEHMSPMITDDLAASESICRFLLIVIISWVRTFFTYVHYAKILEGLLCALRRVCHFQPGKCPMPRGALPNHHEPVPRE